MCEAVKTFFLISSNGISFTFIMLSFDLVCARLSTGHFTSHDSRIVRDSWIHRSSEAF